MRLGEGTEQQMIQVSHYRFWIPVSLTGLYLLCIYIIIIFNNTLIIFKKLLKYEMSNKLGL